MSPDQIRQILDAIEQLDWVQWVRTRMRPNTAAGTIDRPNEGAEVRTSKPQEGEYLRLCKQYGRLHDQASFVIRHGRSPRVAQHLERQLAAARGTLGEIHQELQLRYSRQRQSAFDAAKRRAVNGESGRLFEAELAKRGVPILAAPPTI